MNKSALLALTLALFVPLICYFAVKSMGEAAGEMPRHYFMDSVTTKQERGKTIDDTIWHKIPNFALTNQYGDKVSLYDFKGKIIVVNSFFTRCPNICPGLTRNIRKLQTSFENPKKKTYTDTTIVQFLSLSIDPERDSVAALKKWSDRFFVNSNNWDLLTGPKKEIYDLLLHELKIGAQDGAGIDTNFIHSEKVMLLDKNKVVRGFYNGLDSVEMGRLARDIGKLKLEKDKNTPSLFRKYIPIIPILIAIPLMVFLLMWYLKRNAKSFEQKLKNSQ